MPSDIPLIMLSAVLLEDIVAGAILAYAAYWAFVLRRVLRNRFSRSQAFWLGVVCIFLIPVLPTPVSTDPLTQLVISVYFVGALPIVLLAWIDGTVRTARRSDPLFRDTLKWSKLRFGVWGTTLVMSAFYFGLLVLETVTGVLVSTIALVLIIAVYLPIFLAGAPALLLAARRTRSDTHRTNLKWLGLFFLFVLIAIVAISLVTQGSSGGVFPSGFLYFLVYQGIYAIGYNVYQILIIVAMYCLYRNARSLAHLNHVSLGGEMIE